MTAHTVAQFHFYFSFIGSILKLKGLECCGEALTTVGRQTMAKANQAGLTIVIRSELLYFHRLVRSVLASFEVSIQTL